MNFISTSFFFFVLLLLIPSLLVLRILTRKTPKLHPIAGTIFHHFINFHRVHDYMAECAAKYKTYRILAPLRTEIYTSDPLNVEYILKTNFPNYAKGEFNYSIMRDLFGDGIFAVDGEKWRQQRKVSSHEFSTKALKEYSCDIFRNNAVKLAGIVSEASKSNTSMDIQDLFLKSTLDSIFKVAFGVDLDTINGSNNETVLFSKAFDNASVMTLWRYVDVFWRVKRFLNIGSEATLKKNVKVLDDYVYRIIGNRIEQIHNSKDDISVKKYDILSRFLQVNDTKTDKTYLRDMILSFVIAGKDTTAGTLAWFIYVLCKHPVVQEKAANEARKVLRAKDFSSFGELAARIDEEALSKMNYLHAAITETLRLYPGVPTNMKVCLSDDTLPDGYSVKKGNVVAYQPYAMGRMKFIWGDDAEEYKPERWFDSEGFFQPESPFKFTAFQAGPRICLGKEFSYRQMKIFSAVLLSCFVFKLSEENRDVKYRTMITLHIDGGLHVHAFPR